MNSITVSFFSFSFFSYNFIKDIINFITSLFNILFERFFFCALALQILFFDFNVAFKNVTFIII